MTFHSISYSAVSIQPVAFIIRSNRTTGGGEDLYFDPAGNDAVTWTPDTTNYADVDDGTRQPGVPGTDKIATWIPGSSDDFTVTQTVTFAGNSASIDLWAYVYDSTAAPNNIQFNLYIAAAWQGAVGFTAGPGLTWYSVNFVGAWTQAQVRACKIRITKNSASTSSRCDGFYGLVNL